MSTVLILRHGESTWNREHRWQGWLDAPLTPEGEEQAADRARRLAREGFRPRVVFTSDLTRAARTAEIVAAHLETPVVADTGFRERNGGEWQGCTVTEIDERWPGERERWRRGEIPSPPGGETNTELLTRFDTALTRVLAHVGDGVACIVTHHGVLRAVATRAGIAIEHLIPNLGGFWFDVNGGALCNPHTLE